jgi:hypothetical protein
MSIGGVNLCNGGAVFLGQDYFELHLRRHGVCESRRRKKERRRK